MGQEDMGEKPDRKGRRRGLRFSLGAVSLHDRKRKSVSEHHCNTTNQQDGQVGELQKGNKRFEGRRKRDGTMRGKSVSSSIFSLSGEVSLFIQVLLSKYIRVPSAQSP